MALGPSLKINVAEPLIFGMMIVFTLGSFTIGVRSTRGLPDNVDLDEEKWGDDGTKTSDEEQGSMAVPDEPKKSTTDKLKSFFGGPKKEVEESSNPIS